MIEVELLSNLLKKELHCDCGVEHAIPIEVIQISDGIIPELAQYLTHKKLLRVLLVADQNTWCVWGQEVAESLTEFKMSTCIFPGQPKLLPTESALDKVIEIIDVSDIQVVLAVGSGVINDLVRYATHLQKIPYISLPTAPSMDGYASNVAPLHISGMKITKSAHTPIAIFASIKVLYHSPIEMIQSGFGDLAGKAISIVDWKLSHLVNDEYFCNEAYQLVLVPVVYCMENANKIIERDPNAITNLFIGLINAGLAMAMVGNSRPASGSEHLCSHFWDFMMYKSGQSLQSHGVQVGYATHWMMKFYRETLKIENYQELNGLHISSKQYEWMREFYGQSADAIIQAQMNKVNQLDHVGNRNNINNLAKIKENLAYEANLFDRLDDALKTVGIPDEIGFLGLDKDTLMLTFLHAFELRERYTIFDFLIEQNLLPKFIEKILQTDFQDIEV